MTGAAAFRLVGVGQALAALGAGATGFALAVWVYGRTGSAAGFAAVAASSVLPGLAISPWAGALVDRWSLRTALLLGHGGAALGAAAVLALLAADQLGVWQLCWITAATSAAGALQWPAFLAATARWVPPEALGRASGLTQLGDSGAQLLAPWVGGALLGAFGLESVVGLELAAATFATAIVLGCPFPPGPAAVDGARARDGWAYVAARPGLLGLLGLSCLLNGAVSFLEVLSAPVVLATGSSATLGAVRSFGGAGMVAGSVVMSRWGGPADRVRGIVGFQIAWGAWLVAMGVSTAPWAMAVTAFGGLACIPLINGCSQALWQARVDPTLHGRVFAVRRMAGIARPIGHLVAGALADRCAEPWVMAGGLRGLVSASPGRGSALLLVAAGVVTVVVTALTYALRPVREVERTLPVGAS